MLLRYICICFINGCKKEINTIQGKVKLDIPAGTQNGDKVKLRGKGIDDEKLGKKGETDIAIGNVIGSNIFNIFFILGMSSVVSPITFGVDSFVDIIIMVIASILVYILLLVNKRIGRVKGVILLTFYIIYMMFVLAR